MVDRFTWTQSRRGGRTSAKSVLVDYVHLRQLGTPASGRQVARAGRVAEMHAIFEKHMEDPGPQRELVRAAEIATARKVGLLCYEADA